MSNRRNKISLITNSKPSVKLVPDERMRLLEASKLGEFELPKSLQHWGSRIRSQQVGTICGPQGKELTCFAIALAVSMASGKKFLGLEPKNDRKVVYLNAVLGFKTMRSGLNAAAESLGVPLPPNLQVLTQDMFSGPMPCVNVDADHHLFDELLAGEWDTLIIDSYGTWSNGKSETEKATVPFIRWTRELKRKGKTVIVVHHTGKNNEQRGASRHDRALDFSILLRPVKTEDGSLSFSLTWNIARHLSPEKSTPITATIKRDEAGVFRWTHADGLPIDKRLKRMRKLRDDGVSLSEIGKKFKLNKSTVMRALQKKV